MPAKAVPCAAGLTALVLLVGMAAPPGGAQLPQAPAYLVVVHPGNPLTTIDRRFLSQAFLRKSPTWPHGEAVRPVDLPAESVARRRFSEQVHSRSVAAVKSYWQQVIFSGRGLPPAELASEEQVLRFVARNPGAVGYVSGNADVRPVKVLVVR